MGPWSRDQGPYFAYDNESHYEPRTNVSSGA